MAQTPLATVSDLEDRLGRSLAGADSTRAAALLIDASAAVRSYTGQQFTEATSTVRLQPRGGVVRLPQRPVVAVSAVKDTDGNALGFTWLGADRVQVTIDGWEIEGSYRGPVDVTYQHGYAAGETPDVIVAVVCQIAGRALGQNVEDAGKTGENIGNYSYTIGTAAASGALGMLPDEKAKLDPFRRIASPARML